MTALPELTSHTVLAVDLLAGKPVVARRAWEGHHQVRRLLHARWNAPAAEERQQLQLPKRVLALRRPARRRVHVALGDAPNRLKGQRVVQYIFDRLGDAQSVVG